MTDNKELIEENYPGDKFYATIYNATAADYRERVQQSGWLEGLPESRVQKITAEINRLFETKANDVAMNALVDFEVEFNEFAESYTKLLEVVQQHTYGAFTPENIVEETESDKTNVSFTYNGKTYKLIATAGRIDDWRIFELINAALHQSGSKKLLAPISRGVNQDDWTGIAFVSVAAFYKGRYLGLFPLDDTADFFHTASGQKVDVSFLDDDTENMDRLEMIKAINEDANRYDSWLSLSADYDAEGDDEGHVLCLMNMVKLHVYDADAMHDIARSFAKNEDYEGALYWLEQAIKINPYAAYIWNQTASCYMEMGDTERGYRAYSKAMAVEPTDTLAYINSAYQLIKDGKAEQAVEFCKKAIELGDIQLGSFNLGHAYMASGKRAEAIECYKNSRKVYETGEEFMEDFEGDYELLKPHGINKKEYLTMGHKIADE